MNQQNEALNSAVINSMKPSDKDIVENRGLRVSCAKAGTKSFFYRYISPVSKKLPKIQIGRFPSASLLKLGLN